MVLALLPPTFRGTMHAVLPEQSIRSKTDIPGERCGVDGFNRADSFVSGRLLKPPEVGLEPFGGGEDRSLASIVEKNESSLEL